VTCSITTINNLQYFILIQFKADM